MATEKNSKNQYMPTKYKNALHAFSPILKKKQKDIAKGCLYSQVRITSCCKGLSLLTSQYYIMSQRTIFTQNTSFSMSMKLVA